MTTSCALGSVHIEDLMPVIKNKYVVGFFHLPQI